MPHPGTGVDARATIRSEHDVLGFVTRTCFKTGPPGRVGIESEWFLHDPADPGRYLTAPDLERLAAALTPLPASSLLSFEPGGQLELSTRCAGSLAEAPDLLRTDLLPRRRRAGPRRPAPGGNRRRPAPPAAAAAPYPALRRDGDLLRRARPGRPGDDVHHRRRAGLPRRGRRPGGRPAPLGGAAGADPGARRGLRQLAGAGRAAHRLAVHPGAHLGRPGPGPHRLARRRRPGRGLGAVSPSTRR